MTTQNNKRDPGIDLLRLFAMGMIVLHHLLSHGGLLFAFPDFSLSGAAVQLLNAFSRSAVNAYALISGYVMVSSRFRPARLMELWLQVVFWGVIAVLCLPLMGATPAWADWANALLPVSRDTYWYFTCYAAVFCLSPFLNALVQRSSRQQCAVLAWTLIVLFCVLPLIGMGDPFRLGGGYHAVWLAVLYLLGGIFRLHGFGWLENRKASLGAFVLGGLLSWAWRMVLPAVGLKQYSELLLHYISPTMLLCGAALLALFRGRHMPASLTKATAALAPLSFGVYLIHDNPLVRARLITMRMTALADLPSYACFGGLIACCAGIYAVCLGLEWLRAKLFAVLHLPALCSRAEKWFFGWAERGFSKPDA